MSVDPLAKVERFGVVVQGDGRLVTYGSINSSTIFVVRLFEAAKSVQGAPFSDFRPDVPPSLELRATYLRQAGKFLEEKNFSFLRRRPLPFNFRLFSLLSPTFRILINWEVGRTR